MMFLGQSAALKQLLAKVLQDVIAESNTCALKKQLQAACMHRNMQNKCLGAL